MTSEQIDRMLSIADRYVTVYERNFALSIQRVADLKAAEERSAQIDAQNVAIRDREASAAEKVSAGMVMKASVTHMPAALPNGADREVPK